MSGQNSRTVTLTLDARTNGTESVVKLAGELDKLAKTGGEAAPEFQRLAAELDSIAKQQDAISAFNQTAEAVDKAKIAMAAAKLAVDEETAAVSKLRQQLDLARTEENLHAAAVNDAKAVLQQAKTGYLEARSAISAYLAEIGGAKSASRDEASVLKEKQQVLRQMKADYDAARVAVSELAPAYAALKAETSATATELRNQEAALGASDRAAKSAVAEYQQLSSTLEQVDQAMNLLGIDSADAVNAQNRVTQSMARLEVEAKQLKTTLESAGTTAIAAAQRIENAFGTVGTKSAASVQAEITKVNQAMMSLARETGLSEQEFKRAFTAGKQKIAELEASLKQAASTAETTGGAFKGMFSQFGAASVVFNVVSAGINAITSAAQKIPEVTVEFQTMMRTLTVLTGSTSAAAKEFEYLKGVANRTGSDIKGLGDSYIRLAAATKDTALEGAQTKRVFEAVSGAMGMLGASSAETENALMAVSQMVSKGVVSMEEMRQQLGERLPGAFQVTAKELGITVADLNDLISTGKLAADDVLPAMARGLEKMYNTGLKNDTLIGKWREFTNALKVSADAMGESGLLDSLLKVGRIGAGVAVVLVEGFLAVGKSIGLLTAGIATGDLKGALAAIAEEFKNVDERAGKIAGRASTTQKSLADLAKEAKSAGQEFVTLADGTQLAVAAVEGASTGFIAFLNSSAKAKKSADDFATSARKSAEYTRSAGEASITAANALGSESDKRQAAQKVAEDNARALDALVLAEKKVIAVMEEEAMKRAEALRDGAASSDAHKKQLTELGEDIQKRQVALNGLQNQVEANRNLADAMAIQSETTKDNSARLAELKANYDATTTAVRDAQQAVLEGGGTQKEANDLKNEAMKAERLYVDALEDSKKSIVANLSVKRAQMDLDTAGINLSIQQQQTLYQSAKFMGDEYAANQALLKIKEYQIQLMKLTAQMRAAEAQAQLAQIDADRAEAIAKGTLTDAVKAELKARTLVAQAKALEGKIATETAKQMKDLYDQTMAGGSAAAGASGGFDTLSHSLHGVASAAGKAVSAMSELDRYEASKFQNPTNDGGFFAGGHQADQKTDVMAMMYRKGATVEEAQAASKYYGEIYNRLGATTLTGNLGTTENATRKANEAANTAVEQALQLARIEKATGGTVDLGTSVSDLQHQALSKIRYGAGVDGQTAQQNAIKAAGSNAMGQMVTINIGGKSQKVSMSSIADANNLTNILKQLESDQARY